jgi:enoyl-CoA hydratase/carnithine racemase
MAIRCAAAVRLFRTKKPIVAAIQGAAVGGGFGLAVMPDFRVVSPDARFTANFVKLGFHPGFGLSHTLPRLIGQQRANLMFFTGRRSTANAYAWDSPMSPTPPTCARSIEAAAEIAENAPRACQCATGVAPADAVKAMTDHEFVESTLQQTEDI